MLIDEITKIPRLQMVLGKRRWVGTYMNPELDPISS